MRQVKILSSRILEQLILRVQKLKLLGEMLAKKTLNHILSLVYAAA